MRTRSALAAGTAAVAMGVAGCGGSASPGTPAASSGGPARTVDPNAAEISPAGDIPDDQAFVAYRPPGGGYEVKVPEGWARTSSGGVTSFTDKLNRIQMQTLPAKTKRPAGRVTTVTRRAGRAVRIAYEARSPADPVTGRSHTNAVERYVFSHDGRDVVLTLSGPKGADNIDPWKIVTDSLRYTR
jgi:hypothetical protein